MVLQPAQRGGSAKSSAQRAQLRMKDGIIAVLSPTTLHRTSAAMADLFDMKLRAIRRDRAARIGPEQFLLERAYEDCLERIALTNRRFGRGLLIGCPDSAWPSRLRELASEIDVRDPGPLFTAAAGARLIIEDQWDPEFQAYDLVLAVGTLDTVNVLPLALQLIRGAMRANGLFVAALSGGETVPQLRSAMRAADSAAGAAAPHVHPRIEASALAPLLSQAGFLNPVVDVDRVGVSYRSFDRLVADLRAMAATNLLCARPRFISRTAWEAARSAFAAAGNGERTTEIFEILHVAAWTPGDS
jgi:hypothetical protein